MSSVELAEFAGLPQLRPSPRPVQGRRLPFDMVEDPAAIEGLWRSFEDEAVRSPYQRFDWILSFVRAYAEADGFTTRIVTVRDEAGAPLMLMPLALRRRRGVTVASLIGGKQANYHLPLFARGAAATLADKLPALLAEVAHSARIDAYVFENVPVTWGEEPNPLLVGTTKPSPSNAYKLELHGDPETTLNRIGKSEWRRKLRKKEKALADSGDLTWRLARSPDEIETVLDCFFRQKSERFRTLGITDPFESDTSRAFIRNACFRGLENGRPAIEVYGLWLGERVIATFGGAVDRQRLSCMLNSFDAAPDVARHSPGDILLTKVIRIQHDLGRRVFDLGVGEARYKHAVCDQTDELRDVFVPITAKGRLYVALTAQLTAAKRFLKQAPWAWRMVRLARAARARLGL